MDRYRITVLMLIFLDLVNSFMINSNDIHNYTIGVNKEEHGSPDNVFNGVYSECFMHLSYACLQKKTLLYLKELNNLSEVSVFGDYVKFVKINTTTLPDDDETDTGSSNELAFMIDKAVDDFFDNHVLKFNALGRDIAIPRNMEFVGRKKRKGGGGGGGESMMGGHFGHDDGGKKKMMMMAMMCMKMKLMMMVPAMMGMMGMMSFKGMMFSMMSFMISKMMLLMKILEKKGGAGGLGGGGGAGDGGWAAGGGGGGTWMPAGGQDYASGGGGGGYDANGQWQSRSLVETLDIINKPTVYYRKTNTNNRKKDGKISFRYRSNLDNDNVKQDVSKIYRPVLESPDFGVTPEISDVKPVVRLNNRIGEEVFKKPVLFYKKSNVKFSSNENDGGHLRNEVKIEVGDENKTSDFHSISQRNIKNQRNDQRKNGHDNYKVEKSTSEEQDHFSEISLSKEKKSRKKRSLLDILQNSYSYWMNRLLGLNNNNRRTNFQKYKIINGVKYVYFPFRAQKTKTPKEVQLTSTVKVEDGFKPIITAEDFNKGEIMEGAVEARMNRKKFNKMKDTVNDTMEDNPWE